MTHLVTIGAGMWRMFLNLFSLPLLDDYLVYSIISGLFGIGGDENTSQSTEQSMICKIAIKYMFT